MRINESELNSLDDWDMAIILQSITQCAVDLANDSFANFGRCVLNILKENDLIVEK